MHFEKRGGHWPALMGHSLPHHPPHLISINKYSNSDHFFFITGPYSQQNQKSRERERERGVKRSMADKTGSPMDMGSAMRDDRGEDEAGSFGSTGVRTAETLLRLLPMGLCIVALVVMLKNSETNDFGSLSYSNLGAFRYLVHANGICAGYSLLTAVVAAMPRPSTMSRAWTFFLLDQFLTYMILAAGAVSMEVVYLAYKGDEAVTWSEACGSFGRFCHRSVASVAITFAVVLCYAALSLISSYRLFSKYDAPPVHGRSIAKGIEIGATFHG